MKQQQFRASLSGRERGSTRPDDAWSADRERLKPGFLAVFTEHPLTTLFVVLLFGVLVFGRLLP